MTYYGQPSNLPYTSNQEDGDVVFSPGGQCVRVAAAETLLIGDSVYLNLGGRAAKSLESSLYTARFLGIVVGGAVTNYDVTNDSTLMIGDTASTVGQHVWVQTRGVCYGIVDATGISTYTPLTAGQTTAGRLLGKQTTSYARTVPGLAIKAGASALVKAVNVTQTQVLGVQGTATAANLDQAALSGTTANAQFAVYVFRIAADGTTVTSAKSADAASLAALLWPTGSAILATLGGVIINPTGTGGFVGGTTALDDATVVPNAVYFDLLGIRNLIGYALEAGGAAGTAIKLLLP